MKALLVVSAAAAWLLLAPAAAWPQSEQAQRMAGAVVSNLANARSFTDALAVLFVTAPNAQTRIDPADDPGPEELKKKGIDVQLRVEVGPPAASLLVWLIRANPESGAPKGTILCLHGICCSMRQNLTLGRMAAKQGYDAVLVDFRGHGRSSGKWLTYGVVESRDMLQALDALLGKRLIHEPIGVYGISYGAATAHLLAALDLHVEAVVSCATFSSLRDVAPTYARNYLPMVAAVLTPAQVQAVVDRAGQLGGFAPDEASPRNAIRRHHTPTLLLHGTEDGDIPIWHSEALHNAAPEYSKVVPLEGGTHLRMSGDVIRREAMAWFNTYLKPPTDDRRP